MEFSCFNPAPNIAQLPSERMEDDKRLLVEVEQAQQQQATNEYVISAACIGNHVERNLIENNQAFQPINEYKVIVCVWGG